MLQSDWRMYWQSPGDTHQQIKIYAALSEVIQAIGVGLGDNSTLEIRSGAELEQQKRSKITV